MIAIACIIFMFGASVFSFLNVVICRVPKKEDFVKARSHCVGCGKVLGPAELVPIFSYAVLGGKCKNCGSKIGLRDVSIEVFGGALAVFCAWYYEGFLLIAAVIYALLCMLHILFWIDLDTKKYPIGNLIAIAVVALPGAFLFPWISIPNRIVGALCISVPLLIASLVAKGLVDKKEAVLMLVCGFFLGWQQSLAAFVLAVVFAAVMFVVLKVQKKEPKTNFAFASCLCAGVAITVLFGDRMLTFLR